MATEIRVGGVKYELAGTSDQGNVYVIQQSAETEVLPDIKHQETAIQTANGEVSVADPSPGKVRVWYSMLIVAISHIQAKYAQNTIKLSKIGSVNDLAGISQVFCIKHLSIQLKYFPSFSMLSTISASWVRKPSSCSRRREWGPRRSCPPMTTISASSTRER